MTEKKSPAHDTVPAKEEVAETKVSKKQGEAANIQKKGCMNSCLENPGFPWMVIAVLFTLLVIMFWREHFYGYNRWMMHSGNIFYRNSRMMDDNYGPMREKGMRMYREKIETTNTGAVAQ